jgi:autotransporter-associated beta strand protein
MFINEGTARLGASDRIANANVLTMKSGGTLDLNGFNETIARLTIDAGATVNGGNNSTLTLSGATPIALNAGAGTGVTSVINANVNFSAATAALDLRQNAYGAATTLEINGAISGASTAILGGGSNSGAATLRLSGTTANTFTGSFGVQFGTNGLVEFNKTAGVDAIGTGGINLSTSHVSANYKWLASNQINDSASIIMDGGTLNLNGFNETVASFTSGITGGSNGFINSTEGTLTLAGSTGNVLSVNNSLVNTSKTLDMNLALSGSGGNISFTSGASTNRTIQIGGTTPGARTLDLGSVVRTIDVADGAMAEDVLITSQITGTGGGFNKTGAGVLRLTAANTFSGDTKVSAGTLTLADSKALQNSALDTSGAGAITITGLNALTLGGLKGSTNLTSVITTGYGSLYSLTLNPGTGVTNTYSGVISDGAQLSLTKTGLGTQVLSGTNTYTGATLVSAGTLLVNGSISTSITTVQSGATLGGTGTVGVVTVNSGAFHTPGNSPGIQPTGNYSNAGTLGIEINGTTVGTDYDQVNTTGTVSLSGLLSITMGYTPAANQLFFILANDSNDAITGTFSNAATNGNTYTLGGQQFQISYFGNQTSPGIGTFTGGNDVVLMAIPEPNVAALIGGLGMILLLRRRRG